MTYPQCMVAILPCNDLNASEAFYNRLGFHRTHADASAWPFEESYRMLSDGRGGLLHLNRAVEGWLVRDSNPFGLYLYREDVDALAQAFGVSGPNGPEDKDWGTYEFALSDPDETLVRIGWPTALRATPAP